MLWLVRLVGDALLGAFAVSVLACSEVVFIGAAFGATGSVCMAPASVSAVACDG